MTPKKNSSSSKPNWVRAAWPRRWCHRSYLSEFLIVKSASGAYVWPMYRELLSASRANSGSSTSTLRESRSVLRLSHWIRSSGMSSATLLSTSMTLSRPQLG